MKILKSEKAVSEVVGYVIILSLTITGVAMIILVGVPSIYKLQDMANIKNVEQAFTVIDSRASNTLIGDSPIREINFNLGGGTVEVEPHNNSIGMESSINIRSKNNTFDISMPMGKVKYHLGERIVAYEGGGIWSKYPSGGSIMLSPPEFHYNGRTLTFPGITVNGNTSVQGGGKASILFKKNETLVLFPNTSMDPNRSNPLIYNISGKVYVNITSDYYDAWAEYAKNLFYTKVVTNSSKHTASVELMVVPADFGGWTDYTNTINLRGLPDNSTPLSNLSFKIVDNPPPANPFNSFNWQLTAHSGTKTLIFELKKGEDLTIGYRDTVNNPNNAEIWDLPNAFNVAGNSVEIDLLNESKMLTYTGTMVGTTDPCDNKMNPADLHNTDFSWDDRTINTTAGFNKQSLYNITQHYIYLMSKPNGDVTFRGCSPSFPANGHGPGAGSQMLIGYETAGGITFLHITKNTADVIIR